MLVVFRVDASLDIGSGHVMRCLTLANEIRQRGGDCRFLCRRHDGNLIDAIQHSGYQVIGLPYSDQGMQLKSTLSASDQYSQWLGVDWQIDVSECRAVLLDWQRERTIDWLIVDHYALDAKWERAMTGMAEHILVIDDLANRAHHCHALLDQNIGRVPESYSDMVNRDCRLMTGTSYALLRPEFAKLRAASLLRRSNNHPKNMLISLGGVDKDNATGLILENLSLCALPTDLNITVVMGPHAPWQQHVRSQLEELPWRASVAVGVENMALLMAEADLAIGAAGTTTWERCCLGIPSLVIRTADNQRYVMSQLVTQNIAVTAEFHELKESPTMLQSLMKRLVSDMDGYSQRASELTDGTGCAILADYLYETTRYA